MLLLLLSFRGDHFWFGLVFIKKNNQIEFFLKKTETNSNRPVSVRFGFLGQKPVQTGLARFFCFSSVLARFFGLTQFFSGFFWFGFGLVRFFRFQAYKTKTEPNRSVF
jgi:hypothetical protein